MRTRKTPATRAAVAFFSVAAPLVSSLLLAATSEQLAHPFLIPLTLCAMLVGYDVMRWVTGELDLFDPIGVCGVILLYGSYAAPIMHIELDFWRLSGSPYQPGDYRHWFGVVGWWTVLGLIGYRIVIWLMERGKVKAGRTEWRLEPTRFGVIVAGALIVSAILQIYAYVRLGGVAGFVEAVEFGGEEHREHFRGFGWIFMISESFPIILAFAYAALAQRFEALRRWTPVLLFLVGFFAVRMFFGGLRGSRSNTIWALFWGAGIIHVWVRPFRRTLAIASMIGLIGFMYAYGFFKAGGRDALEVYEEAQQLEAAGQYHQRSLAATLLHDLARAELNAHTAFRVTEGQDGFEPTMGRAYIGDIALLVPRFVFGGERPPNRKLELSELRFGPGAYESGLVTSHVGGLLVEAMLSFGVPIIPVMFLIWGVMVGYIHRLYRRWWPNDARLLIVPFLVNLAFVVYVTDVYNVLFFLVKNGAIPIGIVLLGSLVVSTRRRRRDRRRRARGALRPSPASL